VKHVKVPPAEDEASIASSCSSQGQAQSPSLFCCQSYRKCATNRCRLGTHQRMGATTGTRWLGTSFTPSSPQAQVMMVYIYNQKKRTQARVAELRVAHRPRCSSVNEAQGSTRARLTMTRGSRAGAAAMVEALVGGARVGGRQCSRWSCGRRQPMFEAKLGSQDNAQGGTNGRKCKRKSSTNFLEHFRFCIQRKYSFLWNPPLCSKRAKSGTRHSVPPYSSTVIL
jgi:hypothetical protein